MPQSVIAQLGLRNQSILSSGLVDSKGVPPAFSDTFFQLKPLREDVGEKNRFD